MTKVPPMNVRNCNLTEIIGFPISYFFVGLTPVCTYTRYCIALNIQLRRVPLFEPLNSARNHLFEI